MHPATHSTTGTIIALDVGERRIGVALCTLEARLAAPLKTMEHTDTIAADIQQLVTDNLAVSLVVGLPRGLDGQHTGQTAYVEKFVESLKEVLTLPMYWQDEALTSRQAEDELQRRGKPYQKGDIDALSAVYILEDFLREHPGSQL